MLAPRSCSKFLSYITGWLTLTAWQAVNASSALFTGQLLQGIVGLCVPSFKPQGWHIVLIGWAILLLCIIFTTAPTTVLAKFEGLIFIFHIVGFFAVLIPIAYLAPQNSGSEMFTLWIDGGNWGNRPLSFLIGLTGMVYSFSGADSAVHMSEEVRNAAVMIPKVMLLNIVINGLAGFGVLIAILNAMGSPESAQHILTTDFDYPIIQIFVNLTESIHGTTAIMSILLVLVSVASVGMVASTSRLFWSFARDRGLPFSQRLSRINQRTTLPVNAVLTTSIISAVLLLITIGSVYALSQTLSVAVAALSATYLLSLVLLMWRRSSHGIRERNEQILDGSGSIHDPLALLVWGPFRLPRVIGMLNNAFAIAYLLVVFFFVFWPLAQPVSPTNMKYACVVFGGVLIFSVGWYVLHARKSYKGPSVEMGSNRTSIAEDFALSSWYQ